ncbi:Ribonuclease H-like domain,HAT, C-terminal dimerisation domain [Cinara cedri]|uniref:Ribonuclease H-like domain,HAT, C-terminal dimerisation domain n=1 Tax=Cinara cedri TaxID=506608 RepID=A0A5E4NDJ0_9HEMI|nr:Ribonuclease H-like domain,HAT, C-terminal dimerisation domain [Cinara cedri]
MDNQATSPKRNRSGQDILITDPDIMYVNLLIRVSIACDIGIGTIKKTISEYKRTGKVYSQMNKKKSPTVIDKMDDFDKDAILRKMHAFWFRREIPTLQKMKHLEIDLKDGNLKDIDFMELYNELVSFRLIVNEETTTLEILSVLKYLECFPNIGIALRILLKTPVTSTCAERSFSKLKLINTYLRNKLSQENLSGLSIISIKKIFLNL